MIPSVFQTFSSSSNLNIVKTIGGILSSLKAFKIPAFIGSYFISLSFLGSAIMGLILFFFFEKWFYSLELVFIFLLYVNYFDHIVKTLFIMYSSEEGMFPTIKLYVTGFSHLGILSLSFFLLYLSYEVDRSYFRVPITFALTCLYVYLSESVLDPDEFLIRVFPYIAETLKRFWILLQYLFRLFKSEPPSSKSELPPTS